MKRPSTILASLALSTALLLGGCSSEDTTAATTTSAVSTTAAASVSTTTVDELGYDDLGLDGTSEAPDLSDAVEVTLADGASEGGSGVSVDGDTVTIESAGTYVVSGTLTAGSLVVDAPDAEVTLVLDGVDVTASDVAAIDVTDAERVLLWLADGSDNVLADATGATVDEAAEDVVDATLFSSDDLTIAGDGALSVTAHAADAITSKDSLVVAGGDVTVEAADDGVRGKDQLVLTGGTVTADVEGDALRSDDESSLDDPDAATGVIWVDGATLDLTAGADAIDAARQVTVLSGEVSIAAGDDGIHSDSVLRIDGGDVSITESVEGIEGAWMYLSGGDVSVVSSDDGINVSGGAASSTDATDTTTEPAAGERPEGGAPIDGAPVDGAPVDGAPVDGAPVDGPEGQTEATDAVEDLGSLTVSAMADAGFGGPAEEDNGTRFLEVSGGTYVIDTTSDGVDVNGALTMTGGTLVVSGTDDVRNGALDVDDAFTVTGGTIAANGTSTMAVAPGEDSTQATLALTFSGTIPAGTVITITDGDDAQVSSFTTLKASDSYVYSSADLEADADYTISVGGEVAGTSTGWLVVDGTATGGEVIGAVTAS